MSERDGERNTRESSSPAGAGRCPVLDGFDPLLKEQVENPHPWMARARREMPIFYSEKYNEYVATRYVDIERIMNDPSTFSSAGTVSVPKPPAEVSDLLPNGYALEKAFGNFDPPVHTALRRLVAPAFSPVQAQAKEAATRELAHELIDAFIRQGRVDLAPAYCQQIPVRVICAILGVDKADIPKVYRWAIELLTLFGNPNLSHEELVRLSRGQADFEKYVRALIEERRQTPREDGDFVTKLLQSRDSGTGMTDDEILGTVTTSIFAAADTASGTIGHTVFALLEDRRRWTAVLEDRSLVPAAIDETMRQDYIGRMTRRIVMRDVNLGGVSIPKGAILLLHVWSANRDEGKFPNPERWDMARPERRRHLGFGSGPHTCVGMPLARMEMRVALECLLERIPSARLQPGSGLDHSISRAIPSLMSGPHLEWDA